MVKADGHVRIRHESKENGQMRVRHESKEKGKGINYIEVDGRDKDNLAPYLNHLNHQNLGLHKGGIDPAALCLIPCPLHGSGNVTPTSESSCSCQDDLSDPCSDECLDDPTVTRSRGSSNSSSSRNSKISYCEKCNLINHKKSSASTSPSHSLGGACNVAATTNSSEEDDERVGQLDGLLNNTKAEDASLPICTCDAANCQLNGEGNGDIPPFNGGGFQYVFEEQGPLTTGRKGQKGHLAPLIVSNVQGPRIDYPGSTENISRDQFKIIVEDGKEEEASKSQQSRKQCCYHIFVLAILLMANLLNYTDRYTVAGVLPDIKKYYRSPDGEELSDADAGLLQTSFIVFYMLFSPLFGYMGDRYNRKLLMAIGIFAWSAVTLAGSFVPAEHFWVFVFMRGMVGIGEASYSTIAPTIIADLFCDDQRTKALACFYFAIPVGSGMGYIVGSAIAKAAGAWQWALRFTPGLGLICGLLILFCLKEPPRGEADGNTHLHSSTSFRGWLDDIVYLVKNKTFILTTSGFTCVAFVAGALAFWAPTFMDNAAKAADLPQSDTSVSMKFGVITCVAGLVGVILGSETARRLRHRFKRADPLTCAFGLICSSPFLFAALFLARINSTVTWVLIFLGEVLLCLNWAIVTDILLYVVIPTRRSTAEAFQILVSHLLGDAGSPYLIGQISDSIKGSDQSSLKAFMSLQYSLYITCFVCVMGGGFFLVASIFIVGDKAKADKVIHGEATEGVISDETEVIT